METIYSIYPGIGVARVGNSEKRHNGSPTEDSYYIGPEVPGFDFVPQAYDGTGAGPGFGAYRDGDGKIRREGARFRIYEKQINEFGDVVTAREITSDHAVITWTVSLANRKGTAERFPPFRHDELGNFGTKRNPNESQDDLVIKPNGPKSISLGKPAQEIAGKFLGKKVKLGDLITDSKGRLIVLGGHGIIGGRKRPDGSPWLNEPQGMPRSILLYNHDGICDDTSDGWITATIKFPQKPPIKLDNPNQRAWVIVGPPNFAPIATSPVTLYDLVRNACLQYRPDWSDPPVPVSFVRDIYPLLRRTVDLKWVSQRAHEGHAAGPGDFMSDASLARLSSKHPDARPFRQRLVDNFTRPGAIGEEIRMPDLYGGMDPFDPKKKPPTTDSSRRDAYGIPVVITPYTRAVFELWARGAFKDDWQEQHPIDPDFDTIPTVQQLDALEEAALVNCSGGSFHPGIEGSYLFALPQTFDGWFRIRSRMEPGELTATMSVPWQTDFVACTSLWWPAQRPNHYPAQQADGSVTYVRWLRGISQYKQILDLGFIKRNPATGEVEELERVV